MYICLLCTTNTNLYLISSNSGQTSCFKCNVVHLHIFVLFPFGVSNDLLKLTIFM